MAIVVDASVVLAWYFEDEVSAYAERVLDMVAEGGAIVPSIWPLEVANALATGERRRRLTPAKVAGAVEAFQDLAVDVREVPTRQALGPVLELARDHKLSAYDASYLELAAREGLPLATQDEDMRKAAAAAGAAIVA